ncbi:LysR family transcriptional regulator [Thalassorhabdomicrobium marinisediminis]|uniref:LysR family transcriptional regulator n=1 Tax=Thalassorhabdomicrobium marinisediminis TaxID=2170577 RepID=UPI002491EED6|nr:LysR family transcriptional regulator [Thalassorhabdomicrobium marinisediminis]
MLYNTLRQYEYIVAVADAGSLTEAAARLHVSQPSLSVAITRVEAQLGQPLFVRRKGAALRITPFGHGVIAKARDLIHSAQEIERGPDQAPPFVLGCFEDIAPWYLVSALERLRAYFPALTFAARQGRFSSLAEDLAQGRADLVISYDVGFDDSCERQTLTQVKPVVFVARDHPLAKRDSVELSDLLDDPLIVSSEDLSEGFVRTLFDRVRLAPDIAHRATSLEMMRSMAAHGVGVGISYSRPPTETAYDGTPLVSVPIATPHATADIALVWSGLRPLDARFRAILDALADAP